jgi:outer membrane protein assembly factor BamB
MPGRGRRDGRRIAPRTGSHTRQTPIPSAVFHDGTIYLSRGYLQGVFFASPVAADGKVYLLSETGETFVLKAGRTPEVLATNTLPGRFIASPAISRGRLLLRGDRTLHSIGR